MFRREALKSIALAPVVGLVQVQGDGIPDPVMDMDSLTILPKGPLEGAEKEIKIDYRGWCEGVQYDNWFYPIDGGQRHILVRTFRDGDSQNVGFHGTSIDIGSGSEPNFLFWIDIPDGVDRLAYKEKLTRKFLDYWHQPRHLRRSHWGGLRKLY